MTTPNLAKIERIADLRATWPNEALHFTPWLADNIGELGESLGMDLELKETEAAVGGYSLDILATDLNSDRPVIIENQLETTDHGHLGQLLTYAAGFDAGAVVWVTREFRDEHRQALDWLNQRTDENTEFFGVVVELWRIGNSLPAPHFKLVAIPNGWRKETAAQANRQTVAVPSERLERYRNFFQSLIDTLREEHKFTNARKGKPQSWCDFPSGMRHIGYGANFSAQGQNLARVNINITFPDAERNRKLVAGLEQSRESIEAEIGHTLGWEQVEGRRACRIWLVRQGSIEDDDDALVEIHGWMIDHLLKFKDVFNPRLAELIK